VHFTAADHLGTPLLQTDSSTNVYWRAEHEPYGKVWALRLGDVHQPLRLPGQVAEQFDTGANGLTERSYNDYRWYRAGWGRYSQADPTGLYGGVNVYNYVTDNPSGKADPYGLRWAYVDRRLQHVINLMNRKSPFFHCEFSLIARDQRLFTLQASEHTQDPSAFGDITIGKVPSMFGAAIRIRLRNPNSGVPLLDSTIEDTIAHEVTHGADYLDFPQFVNDSGNIAVPIGIDRTGRLVFKPAYFNEEEVNGNFGEHRIDVQLGIKWEPPWDHNSWEQFTQINQPTVPRLESGNCTCP
jgi:RHS repeat-associated protein